MKKFIFSSVAIIALLSPIPALAIGSVQNHTPQITEKPEVEVTNKPDSQEIQHRIETETKNQGENQEIKVTTREEASESDQQAPKSYNRSETAEEHMSDVAKVVQQLLSTKEATSGGIGSQVRVVAQEQNQAQQQINEHYQQMESRHGVVKAIIGPDYSAIKDLNQQLTRSEARVSQLLQFKNQITDTEVQQQIQQTVNAINQQATTIQGKIIDAESGFSAFGWLFKLFS